jgi:hypothetical protein
MEIFDNSWVEEYERLEKDYEQFYKEPVENLKLYYLYTSKDRNVEHLHQDDLIINNGILTKEKLLELIKINKCKNGIKYQLKYLLKYNISLDPEDVQHFLNERTNELSKSYLKSIVVIDNIQFEKSISILQDLNCIYFIFIETEQTRLANAHTRKHKNHIKNRKTRHKTT